MPNAASYIRQLTESSASSAIEVTQQMSPIYPPSAGGSGLVYALAVFAMMFTVCVCFATIFRHGRLNQIQGISFDHPTAMLRRKNNFLYMAIISAVIPVLCVSMFWNELSTSAMQHLMLAERLSKLVVMFFVLLAINHGSVTRLMKRFVGKSGSIHVIPPHLHLFDDEGEDSASVRKLYQTLAKPTAHDIHDFREAWPSPAIPFKIMAMCALIATLLSLLKVHP